MTQRSPTTLRVSVALSCLGIAGMGLGPQPIAAVTQDALANNTLQLSELQERAAQRDPRAAQETLEQLRSDLQIDNLSSSLFPQIEFRSDASYQSEVIAIPFEQPGSSGGLPPKERYDATLGVSWTVWDGGRTGARQDLERSRLTAATAAIDATLYRVRIEVREAFFAALLLQEALHETDALLEDLDARLREVRQRVDAGAALPGDTALLRAELLGANQQREVLRFDRLSALDVLSQLTGQDIAPATSLSAPDLTSRVELLSDVNGATEDFSENLRVHPQFAVFAAQRARVDREVGVLGTTRMPVVQAFGDLSYGSPGLQQFTDEFHDYWRAGVRFQWTPWDWKRRSRNAESLRIQKRIVDTEEAAFTEGLLRALRRPLRTIERLTAALESDAAVIALREQVERQARVQFAERTIPASVYTDARTDVAAARITHARHRIELAHAQAEALMTLGLELR